MKYIAFLLAINVFFGTFCPVNLYAATPSIKPSPKTEATPSGSTKLKQIEDLKDRLATKVAELQQIQREALFGKVKATSISSVTVSTISKEYKIDLTDSLKVFQVLKSKRTSLSSEDISKDDVVTVFGDYDATLDLMRAKVIFIQNTIPTRINGVVTSVDKTEFTITLKDQSGQEYIVDFETVTKAFEYTIEKGIQKGGFSKIIPGSYISVLGSKNAKNEFRINALRILNFQPDVQSPSTTPSAPSPSQKILKTTPTLSAGAPTPTVKSAKITPTP